MQYEHTQRGYLLPILIAVAAAMLAGAGLRGSSLAVAILNLSIAALFVISP